MFICFSHKLYNCIILGKYMKYNKELSSVFKVMDKIGFNFGSYSLLKCFTVEETITLFAQIRGIPEKEIPYSIEALNSVLCIPLYLKVKHCK